MYKKILKDKVEGVSFFLSSFSWIVAVVCVSFRGVGKGKVCLAGAGF